jgi:hypothetical protein
MEIQIPTVLLILGSTNAELMRIHAHYPLLAFLLSIANTNKRPDRAQPTPIHTTPTPTVYLGPYGTARRRDPSARGSTASSVGIWTIHVLAAIGAGVVMADHRDRAKQRSELGVPDGLVPRALDWHGGCASCGFGRADAVEPERDGCTCTSTTVICICT